MRRLWLNFVKNSDSQSPSLRCIQTGFAKSLGSVYEKHKFYMKIKMASEKEQDKENNIGKRS